MGTKYCYSSQVCIFWSSPIDFIHLFFNNGILAVIKKRDKWICQRMNKNKKSALKPKTAHGQWKKVSVCVWGKSFLPCNICDFCIYMYMGLLEDRANYLY
jgi:hypothetical protein